MGPKWSQKRLIAISSGQISSGSLSASRPKKEKAAAEAAARGLVQFVAEVADTVDILMVGDVEDIRDELKLGPLLDGDLLLDADIVDDTARIGEGIASDLGNERRAGGTIPVAQNGIAGEAAVGHRVGKAVLHLEGVVSLQLLVT
jgi:hypothetical protein